MSLGKSKVVVETVGVMMMMMIRVCFVSVRDGST